MDTMFAERLELLDEAVAAVVEILVDGLQPFGSDSFNADERALDVGLAHCVEIVGVLGGLHGDLGEEDHVLGQLGEFSHERVALGAGGAEGVELCLIALLFGEAEIGQG